MIREEMIDNARCSGWMVDFAEALPFEAQLFDSTPADVYHNQYPVGWMKLNRTAIREAGLTGEISPTIEPGSPKPQGMPSWFGKGTN